ncbi:MAG: SBBP repeat-containing protein [Bacteroidales bacterium]
MKNLCILLLVILGELIFSKNGFCQVADWMWDSGSQSSGYELASSVVTDSWGNIYYAGRFDGLSVQFGNLTINNTGNYDMFLVKCNTDGSVLWAQNPVGEGNDEARSIAIDPQGYVYGTGIFEGPEITFGSVTLESSGAQDIFLVKYDAEGNVCWAKRVGNAGSDLVTSVTTDAEGNVILTGEFTSGTLTFGSYTITVPGFFLVKYNSNGDVIWARGADEGTTAYPQSVATDPSGNILVTGYFYAPGVIFGSSSLNCNGISDLFTVKFNAQGVPLWAWASGGNRAEYGEDVAVDENGNVFVAGTYNSPVFMIDTLLIGDPNAIPTPYFFLAKYNQDGVFQWFRSDYNGAPTEGKAIDVDTEGNVYLGGNYWPDTLTLGDYSVPNAGASDVFVAKYNSQGDVITLLNGSGASYDKIIEMNVDAFGNVIVVGHCNSPLVTFGTHLLTNTGGWDAFIAEAGSILVGMPDNENYSNLTIFPNPVTDVLCINADKGSRIRIFDITGKMITDVTNPTKHFLLGTGNLSPAVYLVHVLQDHKSFTKYFIKQ